MDDRTLCQSCSPDGHDNELQHYAKYARQCTKDNNTGINVDKTEFDCHNEYISQNVGENTSFDNFDSNREFDFHEKCSGHGLCSSGLETVYSFEVKDQI